ncbi:MAG TPA: SDR family NAD(P)-dependent oxidoreductase [Candidatus Dormibacteraeota bacterium]|jgi:short-subunit dehydrogenase|nr:SDR family NAD(P)-dependent oxidoreductase [Candidatus Dormibacteraeota bacterium]
MAKLKGAVVLITGASSGIGAATALAFAQAGSRLVLGARRIDRLQAVAERCRALGAPEVVVRRTDLSRPGEARSLVSAAIGNFDRVDVLVNNAGLGWVGRLLDMPEEAAREVLETNVLGVTWMIQAVLPNMLARGGGVIINIASVVSFRPNPYSGMYSASKAAVMALSHALRGELSGTGIKVCAVYPANTRTEFFNALDAQGTGPSYSAEWVARTVVRTARWPRRDAVVLGARGLQWAETVMGGFMDHAMGELARAQNPRLGRPTKPNRSDNHPEDA